MRKHVRIAAQITARTSRGDARYHPCYLEYFRLFNTRDYYEAHDVLEHIWLDATGERRVFYQALIQFAGAFVHLQHQHREPRHRIHGRRLRPAARLFRRSAELLSNFPAHYEGVAVDKIIAMATNSAFALESSEFVVNSWLPTTAPQIDPPA